MLGLLTYEAVVCLARRRLAYVRDVLAAKIRDGVGVHATDRQVHHLAARAVDILSTQPVADLPLDTTTLAPWLVEDVSRYAFLGGLGPEIPRFSGIFSPGNLWLLNTIHNGTPDPDRARVNARSTDLAFAIWDHAERTLTQPDERSRLKAFILGYLCHIAADVVLHPLIQDAAWTLGHGMRPALTQHDAALALEVQVSARLFGQPDFTRGDWSGFLPLPAHVPEALTEAYKTALEQIYGPGARPAGSRAFMDRMAQLSPPALSTEFIREGVRTWHTVISRAYGWNYAEWLGVTALMYLPTLAATFLTHKLEKGKHLFDTESGERAWYEIIGLPLACNSLLPLGYFLYAALGTPLGVSRQTGFALASSIVSVGAAIGYFLTAFDTSNTLGSGDTDVGLRWSLFIALPALVEVVTTVYTLVVGESEQATLLGFASLAHLVLVGVFLLGYWWLIQPIAQKNFDDSETWWRILLWVLMVGGVWALSALFLWLGSAGRRNREIVEHIEGSRERALLPDLTRWFGGRPWVPGSPPASPPNLPLPPAPHLGDPLFARVFDDGTLFFDPAASPPAPLTDRYYPSRDRPLLKLWWSGPGTLFIRSRRDHLELTTSLSPPAPIQQIMAPLGPMTLADFALYLARFFGGPAAEAPIPSSPPASPPGGGPLSIALHEDVDWDYIVPAGRLFAAFGDAETTTAAAIAANEQFQPIPRFGQPPLVLRHAPRAWTSVRYGRTAPHVPTRGITYGTGTIGGPAGPSQVAGSADARFQTLFAVGDLIRTVGLVANETRRVVTIHGEGLMTLDAAFSAAVVPGTGYLCLRAERSPGTVSMPTSTQVQGDANTRFWTLFEPGDLIRAAGQVRVVDRVTSDQVLVVSAPFNPIPPAGTLCERIPDERASDLVGPGTLRAGPNDFTLDDGGTGARLDTLLRPGDVLRLTSTVAVAAPVVGAATEEVVVRQVLSATQVLLERPCQLILSQGAATVTWMRLGRAHRDAWTVTPNTPVNTGTTGLDQAADLAALLCLGGVSRLLADGERTATGTTGAIGRATEVFRNWNLDQRRVNEWRMLITGRATSERGVVASPPIGDGVARELGWVPLFRDWLDMARRRGVDSRSPRALRPGQPSNLDLSRGLAFLLGLTEP